MGHNLSSRYNYEILLIMSKSGVSMKVHDKLYVMNYFLVNSHDYLAIGTHPKVPKYANFG
jgi:hypothetical protein